MSLEYAILGFLNYHPYSGYDLKKVFDISIRHFWHADQGQIYRTLQRLSADGWVEKEIIEQNDRPDRKVYRITPAGQEALLEWLAGMPPIGEPHSAPMIQVFFAGRLSDQELLAKFEAFAALMRAALAKYDQVPSQAQSLAADIASPREYFFWMLTLDNGIRNMRANLEWAENIIDLIKSGKVPPR